MPRRRTKRKTQRKAPPVEFIFDSYYKYQFTFIVLLNGKPAMKMVYPDDTDAETIYRMEIKARMTPEDFWYEPPAFEDFERIAETVNKTKNYVSGFGAVFYPLKR